ncbi:PIN domain-containing protein [Cognatiyoonia sp. IB215446]|uniref:RSP_2648 family PIN domain-containing protein n=1 Tax=Cognatiyoonia sp. IB215446 TaxID=3097355 RepID=UPI002A135419|nr:PIN domain-containing protein [Cognatiyoonia sp. IB215446]MDX8349714.1 PIN domain-containing protein [Cognatiyoonia sp. IB215446]
MRVMIDACVLYPTVMREALIGCAKEGLFEPRWSVRILDEWALAAAKLSQQQEVIARGEIAALKAAFPDTMVRFDDDFARQFSLPDPNDIHVLAAAVAGSCDAILTLNHKDFPRDILADAMLERVGPDLFLCDLLSQAPDQVWRVAEAVLTQANQLSERPWTMRALMKKARLPRFGKALERG